MTNDQIINTIFGIILLIVILSKTKILRKISLPNINGGCGEGLKVLSSYNTVFLLIVIYAGLQITIFSIFPKLWSTYRESNIFEISEIVVFATLWLYTKEGYKKLAVAILVSLMIIGLHSNGPVLKKLFNKHKGSHGHGHHVASVKQNNQKQVTVHPNTWLQVKDATSRKIRNIRKHDKKVRIGVCINKNHDLVFWEPLLPGGKIGDLFIPPEIDRITETVHITSADRSVNVTMFF